MYALHLRSSGISYSGNGRGIIYRHSQAKPKFVIIRRREHRYIRYAGEHWHIEKSLMGLAVLAYNACTVNAQNDVRPADGSVVYQLVVCPLQKAGIHRKTGVIPLTASPAANVTACCSAMPTSKICRGIFRKEIKPCAVFHGCGYGAYLPVALGKLCQLFSETAEKLSLLIISGLPLFIALGATPWNAPGLFSAGV